MEIQGDKLIIPEQTPTIPAFIAYPHSSELYHKVCNRFTQSKTKMASISSLKDAYTKANEFWQKHANEKEFLNQYCLTTPTYPYKPPLKEKKITSFFIKSQNDAPITIIPSNIDNRTAACKRKVDQITENMKKYSEPPKLLKKPKLVSNLYNLTEIASFIVKGPPSGEIKINEVDEAMVNAVKNQLERDVVSHENLYISLTHYLEDRTFYQEQKGFTMENETTKSIRNIDINLKEWGKVLIDIIDITQKMHQIIQEAAFTDLRRKGDIDVLDEQLNKFKTIGLKLMVSISSSIGLISSKLKKRVANIKYYKKSSLAPENYDSPLQFYCFNLESNWSFTQKLVTLILIEDGEIYPLKEENCKTIIDLFKDPLIQILKLSTIYDLLFGIQPSSKSKTSTMQALNTIMLKIFPIMSFKIRSDTFIIDICKFQDDNTDLLDLFCQILDNPDLDCFQPSDNNDNLIEEVPIFDDVCAKMKSGNFFLSHSLQ
jgi:hypothetical protein